MYSCTCAGLYCVYLAALLVWIVISLIHSLTIARTQLDPFITTITRHFRRLHAKFHSKCVNNTTVAYRQI